MPVDATQTLKWGSATIILFIAIYLALQRPQLHKELNKQVLDSLRRAELKAPPSPAKVAIGFGACLDVFVNATELLELLGVDSPSTPEHHNTISDFKELSEEFTYFFRYGAAAERYFTNITMFNEIIKAARSLGGRVAVGGNAPVIANRLALEGAEVLLSAQTSEEFMKWIWPGIKLAGPVADNPDIHLIMEYKTGETWGDYTSPRANRFILHSDRFNPTLGSLESFIEPMSLFNAKLFVVGGLQMMDNYPFMPGKLCYNIQNFFLLKTIYPIQGERESRLSSLRNLIQNPPGNKKTLVHFELASFVDESLMADLINYVAPHVDSFGMNEQELPNLESALKYGNITLLSNAYPRVAAVLDQMRTSYKLLRSQYGRVSRIHVHTLAFQAIMTRKGSAWKNTMSAAAHSSLTANRHVCGTKLVDVNKSKLLMDDSFSKTMGDESGRVWFHPEKPVSCWEEAYKMGGKMDTVLICIAPNLVCTQIHQTVGGGDNISAAGLAVQI